MILVGIHDFPIKFTTALSTSTSLSWLRTLEMLAHHGGNKCHAVLKEHHYDASIDTPVHGVYYHFYKHRRTLYTNLYQIKPDIILYNYCTIDHLAADIVAARAMLPNARHVVRVHHEFARVYVSPHKERILLSCDAIILPSAYMASEIAENVCTCFVLPFGIDVAFFQPHVPDQEDDGRTVLKRRFDVVASVNDNPIKNKKLIEKVFARLETKGFLTKNVLGASRSTYRDTLQQGRFYLTLSTSEGGPSRSLLEAMASGCFPMFARECKPIAEFFGVESDTAPTRAASGEIGCKNWCALSLSVEDSADILADQIEHHVHYVNICRGPDAIFDNDLCDCDCEERDEITEERDEITRLGEILITVAHVAPKALSMLETFDALITTTHGITHQTLHQVSQDARAEIVRLIVDIFNVPTRYVSGMSNKIFQRDFCLLDNIAWIYADAV